MIDRRRYVRDVGGTWRDANPPAPGDSWLQYGGAPSRQRAHRRRESVYDEQGRLRAERDTLDIEQTLEPGTFNPRAQLAGASRWPRLEAFVDHLVIATIHLVAMLLSFWIWGPPGYFLSPFITATVIAVLGVSE